MKNKLECFVEWCSFGHRAGVYYVTRWDSCRLSVVGTSFSAIVDLVVYHSPFDSEIFIDFALVCLWMLVSLTNTCLFTHRAHWPTEVTEVICELFFSSFVKFKYLCKVPPKSVSMWSIIFFLFRNLFLLHWSSQACLYQGRMFHPRICQICL